MLLTQTSIWIILYPLAVLGFFLKICFQSISFLFHSPVDIWTMIGNTLEQEEKEAK